MQIVGFLMRRLILQFIFSEEQACDDFVFRVLFSFFYRLLSMDSNGQMHCFIGLAVRPLFHVLVKFVQ